MRVSRYSPWYALGRIVGTIRYGRRRGLSPAEAAYLTAVVEVALLVAEVTEEVLDELTEPRSSAPPWPPVPASKQYELTMPTREPIERVEAPSPPFTGLRVELGEGST